MKNCTKCKAEYLATTKFFYKDKYSKDGLTCQCKKCRNAYEQSERGQLKNKRFRQTEKCKKLWRDCNNRYRNTFNGHLHSLYGNIRFRCNNPTAVNYLCYGGRGIWCKFLSFNEFRDYVVNDLNIKKLEQIKGLQIDRIDNNGHYEPGNIRFVTAKENTNNRTVPYRRERFDGTDS